MPCTRKLVFEQSLAPFLTRFFSVSKKRSASDIRAFSSSYGPFQMQFAFWLTLPSESVLSPQFLLVTWLCWPLWACSINQSGDTVTKEGLAHLSNTGRSKIQASLPVWAPDQQITSLFISLNMDICRNCGSFPCNHMTSGKQVVFIISLYFRFAWNVAGDPSEPKCSSERGGNNKL